VPQHIGTGRLDIDGSRRLLSYPELSYTNKRTRYIFWLIIMAICVNLSYRDEVD